MSKLKQILAKTYINLLRIIPIKKNRIYFVSNFGDRYSCNPRAFFEYLYSNHKEEFEFYYCINGKDKSYLPKDVKTSKYLSLKDIYYLNTSKYIINNFRFHTYFKKRKSQIYIQTWHGATLQFKAIEAAVEEYLNPNYVQLAKNDGKYIDLMPLGSNFVKEKYEKYFWNDNCIFTNEGTPRYDVIINSTIDSCNAIKQKLGLPLDKKLVVIAPTFKNNKPLSYDLLDNKKLKKIFKEKLNEDVIIGYRFHPNVASQASNLVFEDAIDLTMVNDSQDIILASDFLITDFSSMIFDGIFANKKCFCYSKNFDEYIKTERNLWIDPNNFLISICKTEKELYDKIADSKNFDFKGLKLKLLKTYGITETGHGCENLYKRMIEIKNKK